MDLIKNLPLPVKILGGTITVGAVVVAGRVIPMRAIWIFILGLVIAALCLGLYLLVMQVIRKRRAASMGGRLTQHSALTPRGISDPAQRAKLDNLRQTFSKGVEKFHAAGKDIYSLPWYLVVGEPGAGKSEAIRHCNVGFPPGLQDELQGSGGTINMHWWFTNYAVILDTAGRLMFEEVQPGTTSEWREFLNLLRKSRPSCPVNGLILVIPVDSLIKDTADEIGRKAARIAQQLNTVQSALDVRFPVFVLITKTDLINGFREFFEHVKDPQLQHQMLGWSNPDPLDQAFRPELVDRHIDQVVNRIRRRRLGLMQDPTPQSDFGAGHRIDDVDALFALPASLSMIAPRLRRYLELVFMPNEWSGKPLFLRGIYFTSAMREGSALDQELAEAIGVPVDSLPEGKTWERERAYFLRDLFLEKVFRERGLVTRATNTRTMLRRRQAAVLTAVCLSLLVLGVVAWIGRKAVNDSVGRESDYWAVANDGWQEGEWRPIVSPEFKNSPVYFFNDGAQDIEVDGRKMTLPQYHKELADLVSKDIQVPWVFKPMSQLVAGTNSKRRAAQRILFETSVVKPLVEAARTKIDLTHEDWTPEASDAFRFLVRLEGMIHNRSGGLTGDELAAEGFFAPLGRFVYGATSVDPSLAHTFEWTYAKGGDGRDYWPPRWLSGGTSLQSNSALRLGMQAFLASSRRSQETQEAGFEHIKRIRADLAGVRRAEDELYRLAAQSGTTVDTMRPALNAYFQAKAQYDLARDKAAQSGIFAPGPIRLFASYNLLVDEAKSTTEKAFKSLQGDIDRMAAGAEGVDSGEAFTLPADIRRQLATVQAEIRSRAEGTFTAEELSELQAVDVRFLETNTAGMQLLEARAELYSVGREQTSDSASAGESLLGQLGRRVERMRSDLANARDKVANYKGAYANELATIMRRLLDVGESRGFDSLYDRYAAEVDRMLREQVGFPLLRGSTRVMTLDELTDVAARLMRARADIPVLREGRSGSRSSSALDLLEKRIDRLSSLAEALIGEGGKPMAVDVTLVNYRDQQTGIKRSIGTDAFAANFVGNVWRALSVNGGAKVNTIASENVELGRQIISDPRFQIDFYIFSERDEPDRTFPFESDWAILQMMHQTSARRSPAGKDWTITVSLTDDSGQTRLLLLQLQFEKTLPDLDQWPSATSLGF